jgi:hypothetical protein
MSCPDIRTLVAAGTSGSPVLKHGPMPPAADWGVNALGFWNAVALGGASVERGGAGPRENGTRCAGRRECGTRWRGATRVWNAVARGDASVERDCARQRENGTFGCSSNVWFTRAQARAYAACGGGGRKRPRLLERGGAGRREFGTRWRGAAREWNAVRGAARVWNAEARGDASVERLVAAATSGSPVLKHGPMPPAAEGGRKRPRLLERGGAGRRECGTRLREAAREWNAVARGSARMERLVAAASSGSPVLKHGPMPPAAEEGVNALGFSRGLSSFVPGRRYGARHLIERDLTDHHSIIFSQPAEMGSIENLKRLS